MSASDQQHELEPGAHVAPERQGWRDTVQTTLATHLEDLERLLFQATWTDDENRWYNPFDFSLNFNGERTSTDTRRFSVYPQAKLQWLKSSRPTTSVQPDDMADTIDAPDEEAACDSLAGLSICDTHGDSGQKSGEVDAPSSDPQEGGLQATLEVPGVGDDLPIALRKLPRNRKPPVPITTIVPAPQKPSDSEIQTRYPDFAIILTILKAKDSKHGVDSVHSLWELKKPPHIDDIKEINTEAYKAKVVETFRNVKTLRQIVQQAECAFAVYDHQTVIDVSLVVGYWLQKASLRRKKMPPKDYNYARAERFDLEKFVRCERDLIPLLNEDKSDYSTGFKDIWTKATSHCKVAARKLLKNVPN